MIGRLGLLARNTRQFSRPIVRNSGGAGRPGCPGENFPLNFRAGKVKLTLIFTLFFGIATSAPWLVIMWSFLKGRI